MANQRLYKEIGERIRIRRNELGMTQEYLAQQIGLKRSSLTNIEGGNQRIRVHTLYAIARVLVLNIIDLLSSEDSLVFEMDDLILPFDNTEMEQE